MSDWFERRKVALLIGLVGFVALGLGIFVSRTSEEGGKVEIVQATASSSSEIWIDVAGAVSKPGVYRLAAGSRVVNGIEAAGGLTKEADIDWLEKNVNKAQELNDGYKLYFPRINEANTPGVTNSENSDVISINSATSRQLEDLPGVGPATAEKIIAGRPYGKLEELLERKMVGQKVWEQIKDKINLW